MIGYGLDGGEQAIVLLIFIMIRIVCSVKADRGVYSHTIDGKFQSIDTSLTMSKKLTKKEKQFWDTLKYSYDRGDILRKNPQILKHIVISKKIGKVTEPLAECIVWMANRYARKSNFYGNNMTYMDDIVAHAIMLSYKNVLTFDETKSSNPFAYITAMINGAFATYIAKEERQNRIKEQQLEERREIAEDNVRD